MNENELLEEAISRLSKILDRTSESEQQYRIAYALLAGACREALTLINAGKPHEAGIRLLYSLSFEKPEG